MPTSNIVVGMDWTGLDALKAKFNSLPDDIAAKVLRPAITDGSEIFVREIGRRAPKRGGTLAFSIDKKIRTYRKDTVVGVIGPRSDVMVEILSPLAERKNRPGRKYRPSKIAHLIERGHGGPHPAPAHPFMRPGYEAKKGEVVAVIAGDVARGIEKYGEMKT